MAKSPLDIVLAHMAEFATDHVFPLKKRSKFPPLLKKNLSDNCTNDPLRVIGWSEEPRLRDCNWAIALRPSRLIVPDVDVSKGKPGRQTLEDLKARYEFPKTSIVKSPTGGYHLVYRGQHFMKVGGFGPAVDSPNYVVVPGMETEDGVYRYINAHARAEAPTWFYEVLSRRPGIGHNSQRAAAPVIELDQQRHIDRMTEWLSHHAKPAIEGEGGEYRTLVTAMFLRDNGISQEKALELMDEFYNPRCIPTWSIDYDEEDGSQGLKQKVANAYASASQCAPGAATAEYEFRDVEVPDENSYPDLPPDRMAENAVELAAARAQDKKHHPEWKPGSAFSAETRVRRKQKLERERRAKSDRFTRRTPK